MAQRSDFAQKLLADLKLRKERLAASQKASQSNQQHPIDAYAYSKQNYRGYKDIKTNDNPGTQMMSMQDASGRRNRSIVIEDVSNHHIVPYGRAQSTGQIGGLSKALAFALKNGGKLASSSSLGTSSILSFLHQFRKQTMSFGNSDRRGSIDMQLSNSRFPGISNLQLKEISKGAQKLNQILRACSNGLNIDKYSIEIGKELLQGAIELEESLRMLVNLQEASEYMINRQSKSRITLLDDDEEEDENKYSSEIARKKQLNRPVFSFDKPSGHYQVTEESENTKFKNRLMALTYRNSDHEKQGSRSIKPVSHRRSASHGHNDMNHFGFSEPKNHSVLVSLPPKQERGRIPNVIAKLMGLDDFPHSSEPKQTMTKESSPGQERGAVTSNQASIRSAINTEVKTNESGNLLDPKRKRVTGATIIPMIQDKEEIHNGKPPWKDEGIKSVKGSEKMNTNGERNQSNIAKMDSNRDIRKDIQVKGRKEENINYTELLQIERSSKVKTLRQEEKKSNESILLTEKRYAQKSVLSNQNKPHTRPPQPEQSYIMWNTESCEEKHCGEEKIQKNLKQILVESPQRRDETPGVSPKLIYNGCHENLVMDEGFIGLNAIEKRTVVRKTDQISSPADREFRLKKENLVNAPTTEEKHVHLLATITKKAKNTKIQQQDIPQKIDEVVTGRNGIRHHLEKPLKSRNSILQEVKHRRHEEFGITRGAKQDTARSLKEAEALNEAQQQQKEAKQSPTLNIPMKEESQVIREPESQLHTDNCEPKKSIATNELQDEAAISTADEQLKSSNIEAVGMDGTDGDSTEVLHNLEVEDNNGYSKAIQEPLTESEDRLKKILATSQTFLHTAEALLKLNIPFNTLHESGHNSEFESSKIIVDCGYEIMKRKGIRQDLIIHHCLKLPIASSIKIQSFDDLVRKLHRDIEKVKLYGRNGNSHCDVEYYLPKMLESDIHHKDPDLNCMWDLGWNRNVFAFLEVCEVIKNVEKLVLNGLLDEITRDLLLVQEPH